MPQPAERANGGLPPRAKKDRCVVLPDIGQSRPQLGPRIAIGRDDESESISRVARMHVLSGDVVGEDRTVGQKLLVDRLKILLLELEPSPALPRHRLVDRHPHIAPRLASGLPAMHQ